MIWGNVIFVNTARWDFTRITFHHRTIFHLHFYFGKTLDVSLLFCKKLFSWYKPAEKNVYSTCLFPAESEGLDHQEEATAQLCGWTKEVSLGAAQWSFNSQEIGRLVSPQRLILAESQWGFWKASNIPQDSHTNLLKKKKKKAFYLMIYFFNEQNPK